MYTDVKNLNLGPGSAGEPGSCVLEEEMPSVPNVENDPQPAGSPSPDLWTEILERVKSRMNPQSFSTWFEPTRLAGVGEGELVIEGPNQFFVDWLAEHHLDKLEIAGQEILGQRPRIL